MTTIASPLDPREEEVWTLDFTPLLNPGETLQSIVSISVSVESGADPNPSAFVPSSPAPAINTTQVVVKQPPPPGAILNQPSTTIAIGCCIQGPMTGGLDGCSYLIYGVALTSSGLRKIGVALIVPVRSAS